MLEISKKQGSIAPNLINYAHERAGFSWEKVEKELGLKDHDSLNIAAICLDRHVAEGNGHRLALRWLGEEGERREFSYGELFAAANRFASALQKLGVQKGERIFILSGRIPELIITALGAWKAGCVFCALFSAFGPDPVATRMQMGRASLLVTTDDLYDYKIKPILKDLPDLKHRIIVGEDGPAGIPGALDWDDFLSTGSDDFSGVPTTAEDLATLHFTSGTTGRPKGAAHAHQAVLSHYISGKLALDLQEGDFYWCTADPGWVTGISYGLIAPLANGVAMLVDQAEFEIERWYRQLQNERVSVWYTAPTAMRMLMKAGPELAAKFKYPALRWIGSVGEPLNPEAVLWTRQVFGMPAHDNWWQTETGSIMIANFQALPVRPGSMGRPMPGISVALLDRQNHREITEPGKEGEIAIRKGWPSMFRSYIDEPERYAECFQGEYYLSGDLARFDEDGYYWFMGRADDVIKSAGHLIGPFEVESALMEHPAVAEAGVIGVPDEIAGESVKAFVALKQGFATSDETQQEIYAFARKRLGSVAPREITIVPSLPKTRSGKIMRRLLKARELGLPEGDLSTLETEQ